MTSTLPISSLALIISSTLLSGVGSVWLAKGLLDASLQPQGLTRQSSPQHFLSLSAGVLLATSFVHLLPEAFESDAHAPSLFAALLAGLVIFFVLGKAQLWHHSCARDTEELRATFWMEEEHAAAHSFHRPPPSMGRWPALTGDGLHGFSDGILIASAFAIHVRLGLLATLAVLMHEVPHHIADFAVLRSTHTRRRAALLKLSVAGSVTVAGGLAGWCLAGHLAPYLAYILVIASSSFIYVALADLVPQLQHPSSTRDTASQVGWLAGGIAVVVLASMLVGAH